MCWFLTGPVQTPLGLGAVVLSWCWKSLSLFSEGLKRLSPEGLQQLLQGECGAGWSHLKVEALPVVRLQFGRALKAGV